MVGYSPYGHGDFPAAESRAGKVLAEIGRRHGKTARQVVLNFLTRQPGVFTIPKASSAEHIREETCAGAGWSAPPGGRGRHQPGVSSAYERCSARHVVGAGRRFNTPGVAGPVAVVLK